MRHVKEDNSTIKEIGKGETNVLIVKGAADSSTHVHSTNLRKHPEERFRVIDVLEISLKVGSHVELA